MTKDLALLVGPDQKWLSTTGFLDKIDANLRAAMAGETRSAGAGDAGSSLDERVGLTPASSHEAEDQRDHQQHDGDLEEQARAVHRGAGKAAEAQQAGDDGDDEEDDRPVQ